MAPIHRRIARGPFLGSVLFASLLAGGCGGAGLPHTHPAAGTVFYQDGQPVRGGLIRFAAPDDPALQIVGTIERDGTFRLQTFRGKVSADGAPEGEYDVSVQPAVMMPVAPPKKALVVRSHAVPGKFKVEATENVFELELPMPSPP